MAVTTSTPRFTAQNGGDAPRRLSPPGRPDYPGPMSSARPLSIYASWLAVVACTPPTAETGGDPPSTHAPATTDAPTTDAPDPTDALDPTSTGGPAPDPTTGAPDPSSVAVHGAVQKGPFIIGTGITATPLWPDGAPIGLQFESAVTNDRGEFTIDLPLASLVALRADGDHFDEVRDDLSAGPLTLRALYHADVDASTVFVQPLTHLIEPRARGLLAGGQPLAQALAQAQDELLVQLGIGAPGLTLAGPAHLASVAGPDELDNAYVFAVGAVFARLAHTTAPDAPDAALQQALNAAAADLALDGALSLALREQLAAAEHQLDAAAVQLALDGRLVALGLPPGPDIRRALDQDFDGLANLVDNCPLHVNLDQADGDGDGAGDACDPCPGSAGDGDGDGTQDGCDLCPEVANQPTDDPDGPDTDKDGDEIPNACDSCPRSVNTGAVPGENCCDPRDEPGDCSTRWGDDIDCVPTGERFECAEHSCTEDEAYRYPCNMWHNCGPFALCLPGDALAPWGQCPVGVSCWCDPAGTCYTRFCTVGDDTPCGGPDEGISCVAYHHPGDAPPGLETLGICMRADEGPCAGMFGVDCVQ